MAADDPHALNLRAYFALRGASLNWRADLSALLRSDAPVDRMFRDALADAVENEGATGPRLDLRNLKRERDHFTAVASRLEWMEIGRWVHARREEGCTSEDALWKAAERFSASEKKCEQAAAYFNKAHAWVVRALLTPAGATLGEEMLERIYHQVHADPKDTTFTQANAELLRELDLSH